MGPALKGANPETRTISAKADHALPTPVHNDPRRFDRALDGVEADLKRRQALEKSPAYWERKIDQPRPALRRSTPPWSSRSTT